MFVNIRSAKYVPLVFNLRVSTSTHVILQTANCSLSKWNTSHQQRTVISTNVVRNKLKPMPHPIDLTIRISLAMDGLAKTHDTRTGILKHLEHLHNMPTPSVSNGHLSIDRIFRIIVHNIVKCQRKHTTLQIFV